MTPEQTCPKERVSRRTFLQLALKGGVLALFGATLYPVARYLYPPGGTEASASSVPAAKVGDLAVNSAKIFRFGSRPGILIRTPQDELKAFSAVCTHLGCTVQYDENASVITCACHNGHFDLNGQVISGPPPKPLEGYQVNVQGDDVIVSRRA